MSLDIEVDALRRIPLFKAIDEAKLRLLAFISDRITFAAGEALCEQGEAGDEAFIVLSGSADILVGPAGDQRKVAEIGANDIVGEIAILCDVPRTATVVASTEMAVLSVAKENFFKLLEEFPEMSVEIMRVLAHRLERTTRDLAQLRAASAN